MDWAWKIGNEVFIDTSEFLVRMSTSLPTGAVDDTRSKFEGRLYILAMEGANIFLGKQWLETLGAVVTGNYKYFTMDFNYQDKQIRFQGDTPSHISNGSLK